MSMLAVRMAPEPVKYLAFGGITVAYAAVGTPTANPARILLLQNLTEQPLWWSFNGIDDHFPMPSHGYFVLDIASNKTLSQGFFLAEGQQLYVRAFSVPEEPLTGAACYTAFYGVEV